MFTPGRSECSRGPKRAPTQNAKVCESFPAHESAGYVARSFRNAFVSRSGDAHRGTVPARRCAGEDVMITFQMTCPEVLMVPEPRNPHDARGVSNPAAARPRSSRASRPFDARSHAYPSPSSNTLSGREVSRSSSTISTRGLVVTAPMVSVAGEAPTTRLRLVVRIAYAFAPPFWRRAPDTTGSISVTRCSRSEVAALSSSSASSSGR